MHVRSQMPLSNCNNVSHANGKQSSKCLTINNAAQTKAAIALRMLLPTNNAAHTPRQSLLTHSQERTKPCTYTVASLPQQRQRGADCQLSFPPPNKQNTPLHAPQQPGAADILLLVTLSLLHAAVASNLQIKQQKKQQRQQHVLSQHMQNHTCCEMSPTLAFMDDGPLLRTCVRLPSPAKLSTSLPPTVQPVVTEPLAVRTHVHPCSQQTLTLNPSMRRQARCASINALQ